MKTKKLFSVICIIFLISMSAFAVDTEFSVLGCYLPGRQSSFQNPETNGFWICHLDCIGGKVRTSFLWPLQETYGSSGFNFAVEGEVFTSANSFESGKMVLRKTMDLGMAMNFSAGGTINIFTQTKSAFFICPSIRFAYIFANYQQKTIKPQIHYRSFEFGPSIDAGYRIWIPNGKFAFEAGFNLFWSPIVKIRYNNKIDNSYGEIGGGLFFGICGRLGQPVLTTF